MQDSRSQDLMQTSHLYSDEYTSRIPTPPRIDIPPPAYDIRQFKLQSHFLATTNIKQIEQLDNPGTVWNYEDRHTAQQILPYLFLGPITITRDPDFFRRHGITLVLCIRSTLVKITDAALQRVRRMGVEAQFVDAADDSSTIKAFPTATAVVKDHIIRLDQQDRTGRVLVCCESGNDRSASVVAATIMETHQDVNHVTAIQVVQTQRFSAMFDNNSRRILQCYWDILSAQRSVAAANDSPEQLQSHLKKRQLPEDDHGQSDDMMIEADRKQYAPFAEY
ncbi:hypothetical protein AMS68_006668 [Peltaster fructicola]|uniref:Tyrosine specific protein phosphatases domain-containing protein n=1 Tax=Peltaster fructicola TaxID=286661 RepID=A0A6H0Y2L0_9PEZI|nr:hypothetical protein AMS68_006668 [Peltaster fructicola]